MQVVVVVADCGHQVDTGIDDDRLALTRNALLGNHGAQELGAAVDNGAPRLEHQQRPTAKELFGIFETAENRVCVGKPEVVPAHAATGQIELRLESVSRRKAAAEVHHGGRKSELTCMTRERYQAIRCLRIKVVDQYEGSAVMMQ